MPETTNETYHPMAFDAIKIGLASPEKIRSWTHRTPEPADKPSNCLLYTSDAADECPAV